MSSRSRRPVGTEPAKTQPRAAVKSDPGRSGRPDATERVRGRKITEVAGKELPKPPPQFGKYEVVEHLATGGMGELLLARQAGIEGFEREVAIKVLLPHLNDDREFVTMFLDEARIVARLNHPNIVQILELGEEKGRYYIAMEYVDGVNLADLLIEADARGRPAMPLAATLPIAIDVCSALHYAHDRKDRFGEALHIVHRDVSPHNMLIAYDGTVKLADFGVATADNKVHRTQTGTVKGKMTFMSPEQATARPVDRRSDIFAMGIVLYVMLTGQHPFEPPDAADERDAGGIQTLLRIVNEPPPHPRKVRPDLPRKLAKIVLKAMRKDPAQRFATAAELRTALEEVASAARITPSRDAVADYLGTLLPERVRDWQVRTEVRPESQRGGVHKVDLSKPPSVDTGEVPAAPPPTDDFIVRPRRRRRLVAAALAASVLGAAAGLVAVWPRGPGARTDRPGAPPGGGAVLVDAGAVSPGGEGGDAAPDGPSFQIVAWSGDAEPGDAGDDAATIDFDGAAEEEDAGEEDAREEDAGEEDAGTTGTLSIRSAPRALVRLGQRRLGMTPVDRAKVPAGTYRLRLTSGRMGLDYTVSDRVEVVAGEHLDLGTISVPRGSIRLAVYPWAHVTVNGSRLGTTPMPPIMLYPGSHRVTLSCGDGEGSNRVSRRVRVRPRHTTEVRHRFRSCR